jgi:hypothetical protein
MSAEELVDITSSERSIVDTEELVKYVNGVYGAEGVERDAEKPWC